MVNSTCPKCSNCFPIDPVAEENPDDWAGCITWTGDSKDLPLGGIISVPCVTIDDFIKSIARAPVSKAVIDVGINEDVYKAIVRGNDRRLVLTEPAAGKYLIRKEWKAKYGTDGLVLLGRR